MPKHHSEDYKISAIKHYLTKSHNLTKTCSDFSCSRISLKRWVDRYNDEQSVKRHNRKPLSYKITKEQVNYAIKKDELKKYKRSISTLKRKPKNYKE